jgi:hypothetical protein
MHWTRRTQYGTKNHPNGQSPNIRISIGNICIRNASIDHDNTQNKNTSTTKHTITIGRTTFTTNRPNQHIDDIEN